MNNLSKTIMTIAVAGSLLLGGTFSSQAADYFSTSQDSTDGQRGNQRSGELYGGPIGPDDEIPIPDEDDPLPGNGGSFCEAIGKITSLHLATANGVVFLKIAHNTENQLTTFRIKGSTNEFSNPLQAKIIADAWVRNLTVSVLGKGECFVKNDGSYSGGIVLEILVQQAPTE